MEADMETSERFALNEWLSDFPEDKTFDEIIDLIYEEDESINPWEPVENYSAARLVQIISDTKTHFEFVTNPPKKEK
jgi:hypothetical protein